MRPTPLVTPEEPVDGPSATGSRWTPSPGCSAPRHPGMTDAPAVMLPALALIEEQINRWLNALMLVKATRG